jgi:hypothetical protein
MLFPKKNINLILFVVLLLLSVFIVIFSDELSYIESLENKDEDEDTCKPSKILQSTSKNQLVQTLNKVNNSGHTIKKSKKCLIPGGLSAVTDKLAQAKARHTAINKK